MKYSLYLILFILFSYFIFQITNYYFIALFFSLNIIMTIILKISMQKEIYNILMFLPFIIFTVLINLLVSNMTLSILIGIRLLIICNATFIISHLLTPTRLADAISRFLYPLKIFKVNYKDISLIITITLSFIPILIDEAKEVKYSLQAKNFNYSLKNIITRPHLFMLTYMNGIFDRINEVERSLNAKAYN